VSEKILKATDGHVRTLRLNRVRKKNALNLEMYSALADGLDEAADDDAVRAVLIGGEGDAFCAGNDLLDFMANPPTGPESPVGRFLGALLRFPKPLVAAAHGDAVGIGVTMLLYCDLAYAAVGTRFRMPFVQLGLAPEAGSTYLLPRALGYRLATELLLTGDRFGTDLAEKGGFINATLPPGDLWPHALSRARHLAAQPPGAMRAAKALIRGPDSEALEAAVWREAAVFIERLSSPETAEAISAFFAARAPR
jgi:enoyl-CoA hydratase/carnithine racemase